METVVPNDEEQVFFAESPVPLTRRDRKFENRVYIEQGDTPTRPKDAHVQQRE